MLCSHWRSPLGYLFVAGGTSCGQRGGALLSQSQTYRLRRPHGRVAASARARALRSCPQPHCPPSLAHLRSHGRLSLPHHHGPGHRVLNSLRSLPPAARGHPSRSWLPRLPPPPRPPWPEPGPADLPSVLLPERDVREWAPACCTKLPVPSEQGLCHPVRLVLCAANSVPAHCWYPVGMCW